MVHLNKNNKVFSHPLNSFENLTPEEWKQLYGYDNIFDLYYMSKYKKEVDLVNSIGNSYNTETDPQRKKILKDLHYIGILKLRKIITEDVE